MLNQPVEINSHDPVTGHEIWLRVSPGEGRGGSPRLRSSSPSKEGLAAIFWRRPERSYQGSPANRDVEAIIQVISSRWVAEVHGPDGSVVTGLPRCATVRRYREPRSLRSRSCADCWSVVVSCRSERPAWRSSRKVS
jgi:hypothetical protein